MEKTSNPENLQLSINQVGTTLSGLRVIDPKTDAAMVRSLVRYGQISPVIVGVLQPGCYEIVDGFKRLRGLRKLGSHFLKAKLMEGSAHVLKAAMIELNLEGHTIGDLDKAFVVRSLYREDRLSQVQIAALLNRHKSWVCRRLSLAERLADEVLEHLRLGLINMTTGRELAKLPRGNQVNALKTILKYRFTTLETARLVSSLLTEPVYYHENILSFPASILDDRVPPRPPKSPLRSLYSRLARIEKLFTREVFRDRDLARLIETDVGRVVSFIENMEASLLRIKEKFGKRLHDAQIF
jgi:hypothetical protein